MASHHFSSTHIFAGLAPLARFSSHPKLQWSAPLELPREPPSARCTPSRKLGEDQFKSSLSGQTGVSQSGNGQVGKSRDPPSSLRWSGRLATLREAREFRHCRQCLLSARAAREQNTHAVTEQSRRRFGLEVARDSWGKVAQLCVGAAVGVGLVQKGARADGGSTQRIWLESRARAWKVLSHVAATWWRNYQITQYHWHTNVPENVKIHEGRQEVGKPELARRVDGNKKFPQIPR